MQGRSEREEREDIHGESSICARGEVSLLTPVWNRLPVAPVTQTCSVTPELDQELSTNPELCRVSDYSCTTGSPGLWQGSSWEVQPAFPSARSSALLARQKKPRSSKAPDRENREFNWAQFITSLSSVQIISSHQPRSGGHQQSLTDLRGRVALFSGWIVPTNPSQAELPAAKLYFPPLSWANICISV